MIQIYLLTHKLFDYELLLLVIILIEQVLTKVGMLLIRCEIDDREEKLGYRLRDAQMHKIPYTLVIGDKNMLYVS